MKAKTYQYYVEGHDEKKLIDVLKTEMRYIVPGKIQILNAVQNKIPKASIMALKEGTVVILIFDTDAGNRKILDENIKILNNANNVKEVWCVMQVESIEDELVRSCNIKRIVELLGSKSKEEFKSDLKREKNLANKLKKAGFDINKIWVKMPEGQYKGIENKGKMLKI